MSSGHKTVTVFLTLICGLVLIIAGLLTHWPRWLWPALAALLAACSFLIAKATARPRAPIPTESTLEPDLPIPPPPRQEQRVTNVALPSDTQDYDFLFSAVVRWIPLEHPDDAPVGFGGLAVDAVLDRARAVTAKHPPHRCALVQHRLNGELGTMEPDASGRVRAMAEHVSLNLSDIDRARLSKLANVRKDEDVWEHERNYERNKRAYLGDDVLKDVGSAVVWWLSRNEERVEEVVGRIGVLAQLSAAANNSEVPEPFQRLLLSGADGEAPQSGAFPSTPLTPSGGPSPFDYGADPPAQTPLEDVVDALMRWLRLSPDAPELPLLASRLADAVKGAGRASEADDFWHRFASAYEPPEPDSDGDGEEGPIAT